jgi:hypothetical protein
LPFVDTIKPLIGAEILLSFNENKFGQYSAEIDTPAQFALLKEWISIRKHHVYLRDLLALSCALGEHIGPNGHTAVGQLEYSAKYRHSERARNQLADMAASFIRNHSFYKDAPYVCPVPASPGAQNPLTHALAAKIAAITGKQSLVGAFEWGPEKRSLKEVPAEEKWAVLTDAKLRLEVDPFFEGHPVILVDDLYQSGTTMHYVASRLLQEGASKVYGLSVVKSRRDTDNQ